MLYVILTYKMFKNTTDVFKAFRAKNPSNKIRDVKIISALRHKTQLSVFFIFISVNLKVNDLY